MWAVAFSPDGKRVAAAGADRSIRVYQTETGKLEATLTGARSPITSLAFFPDSNRLVSAGGDKVVVVWDVGKQKAIKEFAGPRIGDPVGRGVGRLEAHRLRRRGGGPHRARLQPDGDKAAWTYTARSAVCAVAAAQGKQTSRGGPGRWIARHARHHGHDAEGRNPVRARRGSGLHRLQSGRPAAGERRAATAFFASGPWRRRESLTQLVKFDGQAKTNIPGTFTPSDRRGVRTGWALRRRRRRGCGGPRLGRRVEE